MASTRDDDNQSPNVDSSSSPNNTHGQSEGDLARNYFKGVEWYAKELIQSDNRANWPRRSPDGTTLLTDSADHHIRTFVLSVHPKFRHSTGSNGV